MKALPAQIVGQPEDVGRGLARLPALAQQGAHQMGDDLGVGLGHEGMAVRDELGAANSSVVRAQVTMLPS